jgi:alkanesulfonate monooxygenase SsuD/methylene tetrahydromethanopterin reductase-like flavin-dependent oxidoreductase (luciferase family)
MPVASGKSVYPYTTSGQFPGGLAQDYLEPLATLSHLAHATKGSARHQRARRSVSQPAAPGQDARDDRRASKGRVILGAGVGWLREKSSRRRRAAVRERGRVTEEYIKLMRTA